MAEKHTIRYYDLADIEKKNGDIHIIYGEKGNGKSYQVKHKKGVIKAYETGRHFILVRRLKEECSGEKIEAYFRDVDVAKITNGEYNCISYYRRRIYFANFNAEELKYYRGDLIGYVIPLSQEQSYAGGSYLDVDDIIFEEAFSRTHYLPHEPDKLMTLYSTVDRKRGTTKIWMVGNTVSRICPYIKDWQLASVFMKQKQGDIDEVTVPTGETVEGEEVTRKVVIEHCKPTGTSSYAIGKHAEAINTGSWESDPQPHLEYSYNSENYKVIFTMGFDFKGFKFLGEYCKEVPTGNYVWYIYPKTKGDWQKNTVVLSDTVYASRYFIRNIYEAHLSDRLDKLLKDSFRESCIFYSTDLCGTEFKNAIDFTIRK